MLPLSQQHVALVSFLCIPPARGHGGLPIVISCKFLYMCKGASLKESTGLKPLRSVFFVWVNLDLWSEFP